MEKEIKQNAYREKVNNIKNNSEPKKVNSYSEWMKKVSDSKMSHPDSWQNSASRIHDNEDQELNVNLTKERDASNLKRKY